jgi:predicted dinucleotide-binding enzyme
MSYSIIGSGNIGSAIARQFARNGITVAIANLRGPDSLQLLKKELGEHIVPQSIEAALTASTVILAVPFTAVSAIAGNSPDWKGKIVIDATNAIDFPSYSPTDLGGRLSSELVIDQLRGARVVKAFNTLPAAILAADPAESHGRRVIFLSGNDVDANAEIAALVGKLGFAPIILGKLAEGGRLQQYGGQLVIHNLVKIG